MVYLCLWGQSCSRENYQKLHRPVGPQDLRGLAADLPWVVLGPIHPRRAAGCISSHSNRIVSLCYLKPRCGSCGLQDRVRKLSVQGLLRPGACPSLPPHLRLLPKLCPPDAPAPLVFSPSSRPRSPPAGVPPAAGQCLTPAFAVHTLEALEGPGTGGHLSSGCWSRSLSGHRLGLRAVAGLPQVVSTGIPDQPVSSCHTETVLHPTAQAPHMA